VLENTEANANERENQSKTRPSGPERSDFPAHEQELLSEFEALAKDVTEDLEQYRPYLAAEKIYHYIWHRFADQVLEDAKKVIGTKIAPSSAPESDKQARKAVLLELLGGSLKLLHPFMPFVTEEIWLSMGNKKLLMVSEWPA
jgi:valyl-tRNA synthetase